MNELQQSNTTQVNFIENFPQEMITDKHIEQMIHNQNLLDDFDQIEATILLLKNALPKLLTPYIVHFDTDPNFTVDNRDTDLNITFEPHFKLILQSSQDSIETIGSQIAYSLDRLFIYFNLNFAADTISSITMPLRPDYIAEDLCEIADRLTIDAPESPYTSQRDIVITCNESNEAILQSTRRYYRIRIPGFESKPFKIGRLMNRYIVYITPILKSRNFLLSIKGASLFGLRRIIFFEDILEGKTVWGTAASWYRNLNPNHHKSVYFK